MKYLITLLLLLQTVSGFCQTDTTKAEKDDDFEAIFRKVDKEASFPGGVQAWTKYLQTNLRAEVGAKYIVVPEGKTFVIQKVIVYFVVEKNGKIVEVKVNNADEVHKKVAEEAIRVIRKGPRWIPAEQDGRPVRYQAIQAISFYVEK
jgi:periplasmic protein TonB